VLLVGVGGGGCWGGGGGGGVEQLSLWDYAIGRLKLGAQISTFAITYKYKQSIESFKIKGHFSTSA